MVYETQTNELVTVYVCGDALVKNLSRLKTIPFPFFLPSLSLSEQIPEKEIDEYWL